MHSNSSFGSRSSLSSFSSKLSFQALALGVVMMPFNSLNAEKSHQYNTVVNTNVLSVVAVESPTTAFKDGQFLHGFGYDLARNYAQSLNVKLDFKTVPDNATALKLVAQGKANLAMTTADLAIVESKQLVSFSASCGDAATLSKNGLNPELNWVFKQADDPLTLTASGFVCQSKQAGTTQQLASFYNRNVVKPDSWSTIQKDLNQRLPIYKASFKQSAAKYNLDWHLLAAIGYQESYLKPGSVSPTGVRGLMMLTNNTAQAMGVSNRSDPAQSIQGGAKYFDLMLDQFSAVPYPDRNWYALVAYNMGPGAVAQIQKKIKAQGKDPNQWVNLYEYLQRNQAQNDRYKQALQYVTRIRTYLEHIKSNSRIDV